MKEILSSRGFSPEEISKLEKRPDYETVKLQVERMQADKLLDQLEKRTGENIEFQSQNLDDKWEIFKLDINKLTEITPVNPIDTVLEIPTPEKLLKTAKDEIEKKGPIVGFIGTYIFDWVKDLDSTDDSEDGIFGKKINGFLKKMAMALLGALGLKGIYDKYTSGITGIKDSTTQAAQEAKLAADKLSQISNVGTEVATDIVDETKDTVIYTAGISLILSLSDKDTDKTQAIFRNQDIKNMSVTEMLENYDLEVDGFTKKEIQAARETLKSQEEFIDSIVGKNQPDWRKLSLLEVFKEVGEYGSVFKEISEINLIDFIQGKVNIGSFSIDSNGIQGSISGLFEKNSSQEDSKMKGVNKGVFIELLTEKGLTITDGSLSEIFEGNAFNSEKDSLFEKDFQSFGLEFIKNISSYFYLGDPQYKEDFTEYFSNRSLTLKEAFEFYIITGGERDPSKYNDAVKTIIYTKIWGMLGEQDGFNTLRVNTYDAAMKEIAENGIQEGQEKIPPQVAIIGKKIFKTSIDAAIEIVKGGSDLFAELFLNASTQTKALITVGGVLTVVVLARTRTIRAGVRGLTLGLGLASVTAVYALSNDAFNNEDFREKHPEFENREDIFNALTDEFGKKGIDLQDGINEMKSRAHDLGLDMDMSKITTPDLFDENGETIERKTGSESIYINNTALDLLQVSVIPSENNIQTETFGNVSIERNYETHQTTAYINGKERKLYTKNPDGSIKISTFFLKNSIFVKSNDGETYLANLLSNGTYDLLSLPYIARKIEESNDEIKLKENFVGGRDLYMEGDL